MKKPSNLHINATKVRGLGDFPFFIHLGHRHLQKEQSTPFEGDQRGVQEFVLPLDLVRMTVPPSLLTDIEEIRLGYYPQT